MPRADQHEPAGAFPEQSVDDPVRQEAAKIHAIGDAEADDR
ncbi:hypothetical protein X744_05160 [Mesorhizobium sp. LNJC372A00]|nr:hypothetical protein X773_01845 [Mesorhizobium sp. LSJC285A00]ESY56629.1 hypothetical protein X745_07035 [Mesorhizobium sp. LNJC374B00]ESY61268.1 hypothetical protein X744_05160 [Mesorhizobium sp. LNJC372A00]